MTRRGGSGSRRSRGSRGPVAAHGGWAPLAPPRESPARPGTRPSRDRLVGPSLVAAAAAMSRGKPGAGGAGTRRTGWRRRRRRRRLEAAIGAPRLGRTAGPDSRGPGTFQGARGMKPAAREARPTRRSPGLRWALPPLLLLCRLGQVSGRGPGGGGREGGREGGRGRTGIPGTCLRCPPAGLGVRGPESWSPPPEGLAGTRRPYRPPSPLPGRLAPEGGRRAPGPGVRGASPRTPPLAPGGLWPALPRTGPARGGWRGRVCRGRRARSRPTRPAGPEGPGRRAAAAGGGQTGPGRREGDEARGLGVEGTASWESSHPGARGRHARVPPAGRPLPGEAARSSGGFLRAPRAPALPPTAQRSRFAFQLVLRPALREAPVPLGGSPTGGGGQLEAPRSQGPGGRSERAGRQPRPAPHSLRGAAASCSRKGEGPGDTLLRILLMKILFYTDRSSKGLMCETWEVSY